MRKFVCNADEFFRWIMKARARARGAVKWTKWYVSVGSAVHENRWNGVRVSVWPQSAPLGYQIFVDASSNSHPRTHMQTSHKICVCVCHMKQRPVKSWGAVANGYLVCSGADFCHTYSHIFFTFACEGDRMCDLFEGGVAHGRVCCNHVEKRGKCVRSRHTVRRAINVPNWLIHQRIGVIVFNGLAVCSYLTFISFPHACADYARWKIH